ncbi:MAG: ferrochelatase [Gemmatimonadota bacterium]
MNPQGTTEVHLLGFGEPEARSLDGTLEYLERIFLANANLDGDLDPAAVRSRCRELAARRAPSLLADYGRIGGSPLLEQCRRQAAELSAELGRRGEPMQVRIGMQFTEPTIEDIGAEAVAAGARRIVGLPLYPLCGASTTLAALDQLRDALERAAAAAESEAPELVQLTGWHRHPSFIDAVAWSIGQAVADAGASLDDGGTRLYFSAHGTPVKYLVDGPPYDRYVADLCGFVAARLGVTDYDIGYQNHSNRGIEWTAPSNDDLVPTLEAERLIVVPISFIHEQSETLVELDGDYAELASSHGMSVVRVPVPWAAAGLHVALADLVQSVTSAGTSGASLRPCRCRSSDNAWCLTGDLQLKAPPTESRP